MKSIIKITSMALSLGGAALFTTIPADARTDTRVNVGVSIGARLPNGAIQIQVGNQPYHYSRGVYYRKAPRGYVVARPPRGAAVRVLPPRNVRIVIGGTVYYRVDDVYYRPSGDTYVVVDAPATAQPEVVSEGSKYDSIWLGETEYLFKDGQFFLRTPEGIVWQEAPLGAVTRQLPKDAASVWYEDVEYFEVDGAYFRNTPDGYKVVAAPWSGSTS